MTGLRRRKQIRLHTEADLDQIIAFSAERKLSIWRTVGVKQQYPNWLASARILALNGITFVN
jgi:hypothetical protein